MTGTNEPSILRIGTRGSPLALVQARDVAARLGGNTEIVEIKTTGDLVLDRPLADVGGKGLFSKEIDKALLEGRVDLAVHSMKDLETWMPDGIVIAAVLPREDPRDAFISAQAGTLDGLRRGAVVGTSSVRRQAQLLARRPDLTCVLFRGNVDTRLAKLAAGEVDATFLACAGLNRLGRSGAVTQAIPPEVMLPAVAQGAVAVTCRAEDAAVLVRLAPLDDAATAARVTAERAMLEALDGSCRTPIAGLAEIASDGTLFLRGLVARTDGGAIHRGERRGAVTDARALGLDLGRELKAKAGPGFFGGGA